MLRKVDSTLLRKRIRRSGGGRRVQTHKAQPSRTLSHSIASSYGLRGALNPKRRGKSGESPGGRGRGRMGRGEIDRTRLQRPTIRTSCTWTTPTGTWTAGTARKIEPGWTGPARRSASHPIAPWATGGLPRLRRMRGPRRTWVAAAWGSAVRRTRPPLPRLRPRTGATKRANIVLAPAWVCGKCCKPWGLATGRQLHLTGGMQPFALLLRGLRRTCGPPCGGRSRTTFWSGPKGCHGRHKGAMLGPIRPQTADLRMAQPSPLGVPCTELDSAVLLAFLKLI
jgi:hypothetical protein